MVEAEKLNIQENEESSKEKVSNNFEEMADSMPDFETHMAEISMANGDREGKHNSNFDDPAFRRAFIDESAKKFEDPDFRAAAKEEYKKSLDDPDFKAAFDKEFKDIAFLSREDYELAVYVFTQEYKASHPMSNSVGNSESDFMSNQSQVQADSPVGKEELVDYRDTHPDAVADVEKARVMAVAGDREETVAARKLRRLSEDQLNGMPVSMHDVESVKELYKKADEVEDNAGEMYDQLQQLKRR